MKHLLFTLLLAFSASSFAADCNPGATGCMGKDASTVWVRWNALALSSGVDTETQGSDYCWEVWTYRPGDSIPSRGGVADLPPYDTYPGTKKVAVWTAGRTGTWRMYVMGAPRTPSGGCPVNYYGKYMGSIDFP